MNDKILKPFSVVRLKTDDYKQKTGVGKGSLGTIVEVYSDDAYEVDFDTTFFSVKQGEVEPSNPTNKVLASPLSDKHLKTLAKEILENE